MQAPQQEVPLPTTNIKDSVDKKITLTAVASVAVAAVAVALAARRADRLGSDIVVYNAQGGYKLAAAILIVVIAQEATLTSDRPGRRVQ